MRFGVRSRRLTIPHCGGPDLNAPRRPPAPPTHRSVSCAFTTERRDADTICELVKCTMVRRARPLHTALSRQSRRWGFELSRGRIMKKIAFRVVTVRGGLGAVLLARGAWGCSWY